MLSAVHGNFSPILCWDFSVSLGSLTHSMCVRLPNAVDDLGGGIAHPVCILSTQLREESPQGVMS